MVHIITNSDWGIIHSHANNTTVLNCLNSFCKKIKTKNINPDIYDSAAISQKIEQAAKIKKQLEADIFERDKRILQSAEAKIRYKTLKLW